MDFKSTTTQKLVTYLFYISLSCFITAVLNIVHTVYALKIEFTAASFIIPIFTGLLFGLMLAHIKVLSERLGKMAFTDSLTHIYNRLHFAHFLDAEIDKVKRYGGCFSIIFFDLDNFKDINDNYGHMTGDDVLEKVTEVISKANRSADIFARYGGEEFIILAPETNLSGACIHAERLRNDIEQYKFPKIGHLTSSFGVAEFNAETDDVESILERADKALYMAKEFGRNRVEKA
ncbi:MAG: GGDEF domain-containing protein [Gammaproteobacteria bacterium]|nr:GGDEF domain-containing protein [Gammaproteobacteria bacterium]MBT8135193.1 GGDEF domain-containing protein [Gammaproteobacteria bacterium]NNJ51107.1 diguanylate cyclase [Gammaproteobacteria bacterium]